MKLILLKRTRAIRVEGIPLQKREIKARGETWELIREKKQDKGKKEKV